MRKSGAKTVPDDEVAAAIESYLKFLPAPEKDRFDPYDLSLAGQLLRLSSPPRRRGRPRNLWEHPQRDIAIALMLSKLVQMGLDPTRRASKRYLSQDESASAVVAKVCQDRGFKIGEPGVEDIWRRRKKGMARHCQVDATRDYDAVLIELWQTIEDYKERRPKKITRN
jgi:hypothetical protein